MGKTKITSPVEGYSGPGPAGVVFVDGVAETDDEAVLAYAAIAGYGVGNGRPPARRAPKQVDPRELEVGVVGTALRDAAVDPRPEDFLPPTNAGKADPHGPLVVAPGIHGIESQVIRPGQVYVDDLQAQEKAETAQAVALLVENRPVGEAIATFERGDDNGEDGSDTGPLGLSDPGSVVAVETGNAADVEGATNPAGESTEPPPASAPKGAWTAYALALPGVTEQDVAGMTRDQLRDAYTRPA